MEAECLTWGRKTTAWECGHKLLILPNEALGKANEDPLITSVIGAAPLN